MKTLDDVKSALTKLDDGSDLYEAVSNAILQERNKGKGLVSEVQKKHDSLKGALDLLGFDEKTTDLEGFVKGIKSTVATVKEKDSKLTGSQKQIKDLEKSVQTLTEKFTQAEDKATASEKKLADKKIAEVLEARMKGKIYGAAAHAKIIISDNIATLDKDGETVTWNSGNGESDLEKGLQSYFEENKSDLVNEQRPGGGGGPSDGKVDSKTMKRSAFNKLDTEAQGAFLMSPGTNVID